MHHYSEDRPSFNQDNDNSNAGIPLLVPSLASTNIRAHNALDDIRVDNSGSVASVNAVRASVMPTTAISLHNQGQASVPPVQRQPLSLVQKTVHINRTEIKNDPQSAISVGHQSRIPASSTLPHMKHNYNMSSPVHHSHSVQAQIHSPQTIHQSQANSQTTTHALEVGDALKYLDHFKSKFGNQPQVYKEFLEIMKEFKSKNIDTPIVIQRVSDLLHGDRQMMLGFNTFLPPAYQMEIQPIEEVQVSIPSRSKEPLGLSDSKITSVTVNPEVNNIQTSHSSHGNQSFRTSRTPSHQPPSPTDKISRFQAPVGVVQTLYSSKIHPSYQQNTLTHKLPSSVPSSINIKNISAQVNKPVKFNALEYVNKIKERFLNQPDIYKQFLAIIHTYDKRKNLKDGSKQPTGSEVYAQLAKLFVNEDDLLQELVHFIPDANGVESALVNSQPAKPVSNDYEPLSKIQALSFKPASLLASSEIKQVPTNECINSSNACESIPPTSVKKPRIAKPVSDKRKKQGMTCLKDVSLAESTKYKITADLDFSSQHLDPTQSSGIIPNIGNSSNTPQANQGIQYDNAMNFVNKIKVCFQDEPEIYKQFLEILHKYQKELRNSKDDSCTESQASVSEVYTEIEKLLQNRKDLLQEFDQFLPEANAATNDLIIQPSKPEINHSSSKKPIKQIPTNSEIKQTTKHHASSGPLQKIKKARISSLKNVSFEEAKKYATSTEFAFFDKVHKCLKTQVVYDDFLRVLLLYNQGVVSRNELLLLVKPFLLKYSELFRWFKDFVGCKEQNFRLEVVPKKVPKQEHKPYIDDFATSLDTYEKCGTSYRAVPGNYDPPKCSGRLNMEDGLKEVLNDKWVSIPLCPEGSAFANTRKTQYEEYIYKCEDERCELDMVLETNFSTIKILEKFDGILHRLPLDKRTKFRLDDSLEETLSVLHERSIQRIYGDKAVGIIEGLKKNPMVAVPIVLKRLRAKDEEWKVAQKGFNKIWKEQNEKYYLKSLDHKCITFKQNDVKFLRPKSLLSEIETIYENRRKQMEDGVTDVPGGPHVVVFYKDMARLEDAANLIIYHVKRQIGNRKDKKRIKTLVRQFIPDFFSVPRGELSDDERDQDKDAENEDSIHNRLACSRFEKLKGNENVRPVYSSEAVTKEEPMECDKTNMKKTKNKLRENSNASKQYALMFANNDWYIFFRLHQLLCERLGNIYEHSQDFIFAEIRERKKRKVSTALALKMKPNNEIDVEDYYPTFLGMVKNLLDGNMESSQYEDALREMFGIHAYLCFTLDKVIQNAVRQLQHIVGDEASTQCMNLYLDEQKNNATEDVNSTSWCTSSEIAYQKKSESILCDENCYKIIFYKNGSKLAVQLLDNETDPPDGENNIGDADSCFYEDEF